MNRRSFFKTITGVCAGVYAAFAPSKKIALGKVRSWEINPELAPGQIWEDKDHVFNCAESLRFGCVLLSADMEDGQYLWTVAEFMEYGYGAQIRKFYPYEIQKLYYMGSIKGISNDPPQD